MTNWIHAIKLIYLEEKDNAYIGKGFRVKLQGEICLNCKIAPPGAHILMQPCERHDKPDIHIMRWEECRGEHIGDSVFANDPMRRGEE